MRRMGMEYLPTWKTAVAVNFHHLYPPKPATIAQKKWYEFLCFSGFSLNLWDQWIGQYSSPMESAY